jgi:transposase
VFVSKGRGADNIAGFAQYLRAHNAVADNITAACIDMSPAFIKGVTEHLPKGCDHLRQVPCRRPCERGGGQDAAHRTEDRSGAQRLAMGLAQGQKQTVPRPGPRSRSPRRSVHHLDRRQFNIVSAMLAQWCTNVMRSKVEPMKRVAAMIRTHFDGIVNWTRSRQTSGFIEAINGLFQAAKRKARGYTRFQTMKTVIFLISGKLNFAAFNPHAA